MNRYLLCLLCLIIRILPAQIVPTDYSLPANWAAGKMKITNDVAFTPNFTIVGPDTSSQTLVSVMQDTASDYDLFCVYPTLLLDNDSVAATYPINIESKLAADLILNWEMSSFSQFGTVYAPYYRQGNLATFYPTTSFAAQTSVLDTAVTDLMAAFDYYMQNYNHGKKVILVGHSQGAITLGMILRRWETDPVRRSYFNSIFLSVLMGTESGPFISVDSFTGGWWQHTPLCQNATDTACIMTWGTHEYGSPLLSITTLIPFNPNLVADSFMYENLDTGKHKVFGDPLGFTSEQRQIRFSVYPTSLFSSVTGTNYGVNTGFIGYTDMYYGSISNPDALNYGFMVERIPGIPGDERLDPLSYSSISDYHVYDAYVGIGDVLCLIYEKMDKVCPYNFVVTGTAAQSTPSQNISVFPNPVTDRLNIQWPGGDGTDVYVYNTLGQPVIHSAKTNSINFAPLNQGVYFVVAGSNYEWKQVVVKQ